MNIYVHIPFCHSKCAYCAFLSHCEISKEDEYIRAVCAEISNFKSQISMSSLVTNPGISSGPSEGDPRVRKDDSRDWVVETIYFGGGTPSMISPHNVSRIIAAILEKVPVSGDIEITLESNPEDITTEKLRKWKDAGINRISIGVQTLNDDSRKVIGRALESAEVLNRVELAMRYFTNVGVDLISGLPSDSAGALMESIKVFDKLGIKHISLYDLETDNDSQIAKYPEKYNLPSENEEADVLLSAWRLLESLGYEQYEISNFTKEQYYCRHNLDFWHGRDYRGFGLGAASRIGNQVLVNGHDIEKYLAGKYLAETEILSQSELDSLALLSAARLNSSFRTALLAATGSDVLPLELIESKLVISTYTLTAEGKLVYNQVVNRLLNHDENNNV